MTRSDAINAYLHVVSLMTDDEWKDLLKLIDTNYIPDRNNKFVTVYDVLLPLGIPIHLRKNWYVLLVIHKCDSIIILYNLLKRYSGLLLKVNMKLNTRFSNYSLCKYLGLTDHENPFLKTKPQMPEMKK